MPHGQEPINESHSLLVSSLFSFSAPGSFLPSDLCSIKKWFIMGGCVKRWTFFWNKISLKDWKRSSLHAPGSGTPVSHSVLEISLFSFSAPAPSFLPLSGVIRNGSPQYKGLDVGNILEQKQFNRLQMVQFECPRVRKFLVSSTFDEFPFPIFWILRRLRRRLCKAWQWPLLEMPISAYIAEKSD